MEKAHWGEAGLVFVVVLSGSALLLPGLVDAEVEPGLLLSEQRQSTQLGKNARYFEDYTLAGFRDFQVFGQVHPLLLEYRRDLERCGLTGESQLRFEVVVNADGERSHSHAEAVGADADCLEEVLAQIPFEGLAPPTGTLVASGRARGDELTAAPDAWRSRDMYRNQLMAIKDDDSWVRPGGKGNDRFLTSDALHSINGLLDCSDEHAVIWVDATLTDIPWPGTRDWEITTVPSAPCVEDAVKENKDALIAAAFGDRVVDPTLFTITFNVLSGYPESR